MSPPKLCPNADVEGVTVVAETFGELRQDLKTMATRLADFGRSL